MHDKVLKFISVIRDSFIGSQQVYTEGSCYHFYLILKEIFPEAECWYNQDHILTKINRKYYDITGEVKGCKYEKIEDLEVPDYNLNKPFNIYKNING